MITIYEVRLFLNEMLAYVVEMETDDRHVDETDLKTISALRFAIAQNEEIEKLKRELEEALDTREARLNALRKSGEKPAS